MNTSLTRRAFLQQVATASVVAFPGTLRTAPGSEWPLRLATSSVMFADLPIEQVCERVARLGLEALDIWCPFGPCRHLDDVDTRLGADGLKELLSKHKLQLCAFSVYGVGFKRYANLIGKFGGGIAVRESQYGKVASSEIQSRLRSFFEALKPDIDLASAANARLAIENHGDALLDTIDSMKAFVDLNPAPKHVGIALAPYHVQAGKASVEEAIAACGSQLLFFYAWQKGDDFAQLPGHGPTDFAPWLKALADSKYPHHVTAFMHGHPTAEAMEQAVAKSRDYLRSCHTRAHTRP